MLFQKSLLRVGLEISKCYPELAGRGQAIRSDLLICTQGKVRILCTNNLGSVISVPCPLPLSSDLGDTLLLLFLLRQSQSMEEDSIRTLLLLAQVMNGLPCSQT